MRLGGLRKQPVEKKLSRCLANYGTNTTGTVMQLPEVGYRLILHRHRLALVSPPEIYNHRFNVSRG